MLKIINKKRIPYLRIIFCGLWPSFIKKTIYRLKGAKIGKHVKIGFGSILLSKDIIIGKYVKISPFVIISSDWINIGEMTTIQSFSYFDIIGLKIGKHTRIREFVSVAGNKSKKSILSIGDKCLILQNTIINPTDEITIGNNTVLGGSAKLFAHSSWLSILDGYPVIKGPINIGKNVWISYDTTILSNVDIGNDVIILPKSVININIPNESIVGGYPLKIRKNFFKRDLNNIETNKILLGIKNDFIDILLFDDFLERTTIYNEMYVKKRVAYIVTNNKININSQLLIRLSKKYRIIILCLVNYNKEIDNEINNKISVVYLLNKIPKVINYTSDCNTIITFLSRYGIR